MYSPEAAGEDAAVQIPSGVVLRHGVAGQRGAGRAGVGRLVLFGHHPDRSDTEIDQLLAACSGNGLQVDAAREGSEYTLQED